MPAICLCSQHRRQAPCRVQAASGHISRGNHERAGGHILFQLTFCRSSLPPQLQKKSPPSAADKEEAERLKTEGNNLMRTEKFVDALDMYSKAINLDGGNPVFYCNRAAAHSKMNNHHLAIEDCQRAIDMDPSYSKAYGRMGLAHRSVPMVSKLMRQPIE